MTNTAQQRARNLGSNYTTFRYGGKSIAYLEKVVDSGVEPVAGSVTIHPLGYRHPTEFVTARAVGAGFLTVTITEMWRQEIWQQLAGLANSHDIVDVFEAVARNGSGISCVKIISPPTGPKYGKTYHNCIITQIQDGEDFSITSMNKMKDITIAYTHSTPL